ncbi:MAG TPA: M20/M25/M40 family metallo-hydrolase [Candidatus Acidoferrum sp.]|nr:M20/M25/M40 family metallo-hydrolase [Candidatus Acidoferrum sp.]
MTRVFGLAAVLCGIAVLPVTLRAQSDAGINSEARGIFQKLIETNTSDSVGSVTKASEAMAKRLLAAGFTEKDVIVAGPNERKKNLVVRYHGSGKKKPILFIGHLDVVEARREDWSVDPFQFIEKDGFFYGRGTQDMKAGDAILAETFVRLKREGFVPDRDLILALTADEEGGNYNGIDWLVKEHRDWIDAEFCINLDGGEFEKLKGKRVLAGMQASEKLYADFQLETRNPGGHSSVPGAENAIYELSAALLRVQAYSFPVEINEITRNYFGHAATLTSGQLSADLRGAAKEPPDPESIKRLSNNPYYNSLLHTTCVATMLAGGHAPNALPQMARANVNCRIFPGEDPEHVHKALERVVADTKVSITAVVQKTADGQVIPIVTVPPSPLLPEVTGALDRTLATMWPGLPIVPTMSTGATDGKYLRIAGIPTYGIACMFFDMEDHRAHGKDERIGVQDFYDGVEFGYRFVKTLSTR